jgi:hypothetical protein
MSDFSAFLAQNKIKHENVKYVASKDFVDKQGKPLEWELKRIDSDTDESIRRSCMRQIKVVGKANQFRSEMDTTSYITKLTVATIVFPDLNNKELQDSYGVMGADALIKKMLAPGEYADLCAKVSEVNGFDTDMNDMVEEAKN